MIKYIVLVLIILLSVFAYMTMSDKDDSQYQSYSDDEGEVFEEWEPLKVTGDAIPWEVFAKTKEHESCVTKDAEGYDICLIKPEYSDEIRAFDGKEVTLMGYMFPLEQEDEQDIFLLGPYPLSCPFHYHVGSSQIVEVIPDGTIDFSYDPITITGTLKLRFNEETGIFYYLENAR